jgi:hypothetical protein
MAKVKRELVPLLEVPDHRPWVSVGQLRRWVYERKIPFHKLSPGRGGRVLIDLADIDSMAEAGRVEPVAS